MPRPIAAPEPDGRLDREAVLREVARGLPHEKDRLATAFENMAYADLAACAYEERREGETEFDFVRRPRKSTGFVHQVVARLCAHTYAPGPHRSTGVPALDDLLQRVYEQNHVDSLMGEAERLSTINDVAAIQVRWTGGRRPDRPIDLQLWGAEEFAVFESPDDPREPGAVVTIDRRDETTRFRVWFDDAVHTLVTGKAGGPDGKATAGGAVALEEAGSPRPNPYGVIPFAFVHYRAPVRQFWTASPGTFLRRAEATANREISELAEAIVKYSCPIGWFKNVPVEWNPEVGPERFLRLSRGGPSYSGDGFSDPGDPEAGYLQAELAIEAIWQDVRNTLDQCAEACDLPPSALRLDYADAPSGISIVARTFPLLERARLRRPIYQRAERELVRVVAAVHAAMAGDRAIGAAGRSASVLLAWPEPRVPIPGPDRDETDGWEIRLGIKSRVQVIEERYGLTREQALDHLGRVAEDEREAAAILPRPAPERAPGPGGGGDGDGGDGGDDGEDGEGDR